MKYREVVVKLWDRFKVQRPGSAWVGLDSGRTATKGVLLNRHQNTVECAFCQSWPSTSTVLSNTTTGFPPLARKRAVLALKDKEAFIRRFLVPKHFLDKDILSHIESEAPHLLPYSLESLYFDFCVVEGGHPIKDSKEVLLIATEKNNPSLPFALVNTLKMKAEVIELESHAISRVLLMQKARLALPSAPHEGVVVIEASDTRVRLYLFASEKIVDHTAFDDEGGKEGGKEGGLESWQPSLKALISRNPQMNIQGFLMGGGRAVDAQFVLKLENHLDIKISIINPFANLKINSQLTISSAELEKQAPQFLISMGLALRKCDHAH